ncbi:RNA polymerase sigma-70 factor, ECF subfamily [Lachnospiraceae bacterium TWA4]|nr:RNA polymerase sigma-70 factor, ECF subfamily [Lachnospiraceae bacterium TWA4]
MIKNLYNTKLFDDAYKKYNNLIYQVAHQYLFDSYTSQDVTQEVFVRLFTNTKPFNDEEHVKAWILRVTINLCKNILKSKDYTNIELNDELGLQDQSFENQSNQKVDIYNGLKELTRDQQIYIYLNYYLGYTTKEISELLNLNENTIKSHLSRSRKILKDCI